MSTPKNQGNIAYKVAMSYVNPNCRLGRETVVVKAADSTEAHTKALELAELAKLNYPKVISCVEY